MFQKIYSTYILTNQNRTVLYVGSTDYLAARLIEHYLERKSTRTFCGRYNCHFLLYYETFFDEASARAREYQIKGWTRKKKITLISATNRGMKFLNSEILDWPPEEDYFLR